ncbi:MAG: hypothetical protein KTR22_15175 [Flavobacteriaceae bacterium]|nr:hypothetical protein [Flavobacteriaceae bacterium]
MTENRKTYKASKVKSFLFFLLLAMIFWILAKFSTETSALVEANVFYDNVPENVSVIPESTDKLSFVMKTNGFQALSYEFKQPSIHIDISRYFEEGDTLIELRNTDLVKLISSQLDNSAGISNLSTDTWRVMLDRLETRKVPVKLAAEIKYKEGYRNLGAITIKPDSIVLMGPLMKLQQITHVETENVVIKNASDKIERNVALQFPIDTDVSSKTQEVSVMIEVEEFTQKEFQVPVQLENAPLDMEVKLLPSEITVSFNVAMSQFNAVSSGDFKLVCDYNKRNEAESYLVPVLEAHPNHLYDLELATKRVEYLIFK